MNRFELLRQSAEVAIHDMEEMEKRGERMLADNKRLDSMVHMAVDEMTLLLPHKQGCCLVKKLTGQKTDGDKCDCGARDTPFFKALYRLKEGI